MVSAQTSLELYVQYVRSSYTCSLMSRMHAGSLTHITHSVSPIELRGVQRRVVVCIDVCTAQQLSVPVQIRRYSSGILHRPPEASSTEENSISAPPFLGSGGGARHTRAPRARHADASRSSHATFQISNKLIRSSISAPADPSTEWFVLALAVTSDAGQFAARP